MDVTQTQPTPPIFQSTAPAEAQAGSGVISSDFETFLRMLTTQMTNQDPLNPIESSDYAVQLATFSGVEQQVLTNSLLTELSARMGASDISQAASWIGMDARTEGPGYFGGSDVRLSVPTNSAADASVLVVRDAVGNTVQRMAIDVGQTTAFWDGTDATGNTMPHGAYAFSVEHSDKGEFLGSQPVDSYGQVIEARMASGGAELVLLGGRTVPATAITAVRTPQGPV